MLSKEQEKEMLVRLRKEPLAAGWKVYISRTTAKPYWHHKESNTTCCASLSLSLSIYLSIYLSLSPSPLFSNYESIHHTCAPINSLTHVLSPS